MRQLFASLSLLLSFFSFSSAQETIELPKSTATNSNESALLWEINGEEIDQPSYLFGTIHMIGADDFFMPDGLEEIVKKVDLVAFEINMEDMSDMSKMMGLITQAYMTNDTTLSDLLSEEEYKTVDQHFQKMGLPLPFLARIKPMFLSAFASEDIMNMQSNPGSMKSYEMEIMQLAKGAEKTIGGLETVEYQMSLFDSIPYKVQAQMLMKSITETSETEGADEFEHMVELYKSQDIEGMQTLMKSDEEGIGRYENLLLINRNLNWIPAMKEMMTKGASLFAVGAGHLGGEKGVLNLLRKAGFQVKPVK